MTGTPPPPLVTEDVAVWYGTKQALAGVSLEFEAGSITALVGPSGCGKTTFLQSLNRLTDLIPGCRVSGSVRFDGKEVYAPSADLLQLRRQVGMIFQQPNPFPLSIRKNFELPLREYGIRHRTELEAAMRRALGDVGLWHEVKDRLDSPATDLSGGQQQRLCIARALALQPQIVLFDEPCSALDPLSSRVVEDLIASFEDRFTVVIVTHNLQQARRIAHRTALFWSREGCGRLVESASTERFFADPNHVLSQEYVSGLRG